MGTTQARAANRPRSVDYAEVVRLRYGEKEGEEIVQGKVPEPFMTIDQVVAALGGTEKISKRRVQEILSADWKARGLEPRKKGSHK